MWFADRQRTERRLNALEDALAETQRALAVVRGDLETLKGEAFALEELRRQARNAVRSLERAAANAQDAPGPTNGKRQGVDLAIPPIEPPGPRRNY